MDETVLITGCSSGIGRATAAAFRDEGWTVFATARDPSTVDVDGVEAVELDVTDPEECKAAVDRAAEEAGGVDCLVNNAGFNQFGAVEDVPPRRVHRQFDVNVYGPHRMLRWTLPHMREAGEGTVVNVSSILGRVSGPGYGVYAASKHALEAMSDALRAELDGHGVEVVVVEPGPVDSRFHARAAAEAEAFDRTGAYDYLYRAYEDRAALGDIGSVDPDEVAETIVEAATCADPEPRYAVGEVAKASGLVRYLPDRWRDAVFRLGAKVLR